eukprot:4147900-Prymnesium_polylepis.1
MTGSSSTIGVPKTAIPTVSDRATKLVQPSTIRGEKPEGQGGTFRFLRRGAEIGFAVFRGEPSMIECLERHRITTLTPWSRPTGATASSL